MKLAIDDDWTEYLDQIGPRRFSINALTRMKMHNEKIAAQLTLSYFTKCRESDRLTTEVYKEYLNLLNKGQI